MSAQPNAKGELPPLKDLLTAAGISKPGSLPTPGTASLPVAPPGGNLQDLLAQNGIQAPRPSNLDLLKKVGQGFTGLPTVVGEGLRLAGAEKMGQPLIDTGNELTQEIGQTITPEGQAAFNRPVWDSEKGGFGATPLRSVGYAALESLPGTVAMGAVGKGLQVATKLPLLAEGAANLAGKAGAGQKVQGLVKSLIESGLPYGAAEGVFSGLQNAEQARQEIEAIPHAKLYEQSPAYQAIFDATDPNLNPVDRVSQAKTNLSLQAEKDIFQNTALTTGGISAATGGGMFGMLDRPASSVLRGVGKGAFTEGVLQEAPQSGLEQMWQNLATKNYVDPNQALGEGVINATLTGAGAGALMGGPFGGLASMGGKEQPAPGVTPPGITAPTAQPPSLPGLPPPAPVPQLGGPSIAGTLPPYDYLSSGANIDRMAGINADAAAQDQAQRQQALRAIEQANTPPMGGLPIPPVGPPQESQGPKTFASGIPIPELGLPPSSPAGGANPPALPAPEVTQPEPSNEGQKEGGGRQEVLTPQAGGLPPAAPGPLSAEDLSNLFDEAAAEATQEKARDPKAIIQGATRPGLPTQDVIDQVTGAARGDQIQRDVQSGKGAGAIQSADAFREGLDARDQERMAEIRQGGGEALGTGPGNQTRIATAPVTDEDRKAMKAGTYQGWLTGPHDTVEDAYQEWKGQQPTWSEPSQDGPIIGRFENRRAHIDRMGKEWRVSAHTLKPDGTPDTKVFPDMAVYPSQDQARAAANQFLKAGGTLPGSVMAQDQSTDTKTGEQGQGTDLISAQTEPATQETPNEPQSLPGPDGQGPDQAAQGGQDQTPQAPVGLPGLNQPQETPNAETVRGDQGQPGQSGQAPQGGQVGGGGDVHQPGQGEKGPVAAGEKPAEGQVAPGSFWRSDSERRRGQILARLKQIENTPQSKLRADERRAMAREKGALQRELKRHKEGRFSDKGYETLFLNPSTDDAFRHTMLKTWDEGLADQVKWGQDKGKSQEDTWNDYQTTYPGPLEITRSYFNEVWDRMAAQASGANFPEDIKRRALSHYQLSQGTNKGAAIVGRGALKALEKTHPGITAWAKSEYEAKKLSPTEPTPPKDGQIESGERLLSVSGRELSPAPNIDTTTEGKRAASRKRLNEWMHQEALKEYAPPEGGGIQRITNESQARAFHYTSIKAINPARMSQADQDTLNLLLFGDEKGPTANNRIPEKNRGAGSENLPTPTEEPTHPFKIGDTVIAKTEAQGSNTKLPGKVIGLRTLSTGLQLHVDYGLNAGGERILAWKDAWNMKRVETSKPLNEQAKDNQAKAEDRPSRPGTTTEELAQKINEYGKGTWGGFKYDLTQGRRGYQVWVVAPAWAGGFGRMIVTPETVDTESKKQLSQRAAQDISWMHMEGVTRAVREGLITAQEATAIYPAMEREHLDAERRYQDKGQSQDKPTKSLWELPAFQIKRDLAKQKLRRVIEAQMYTEALNLPDLQAQAGQAFDDWLPTAQSAILEWLITQSAEAQRAGDTARATMLNWFAQDGQVVAPKEFFQTLHKELLKRAKQAEKEAARDPAVYNGALALAFSKTGDGHDFNAYKLGWDAALAGKTRSTLPPGDQAADAGFMAATSWIKTDHGKAWYEGKRGTKLENTGDALRRSFDKAKKDLDEASKTDADLAMAQFDKATARAEFFRDLAGEGATPGTARYIDRVRGAVLPFKEWAAEKKLGISRYSRERSFQELLTEWLKGKRSSYGDAKDLKTPEERIALLKNLAEDYVDQVSKLAEPIRGAMSIQDAAQRFLKPLLTESGYQAMLDAKGLWSWDAPKSDLSPFGQDVLKFINNERRGLRQLQPVWVNDLLRNENSTDEQAKKTPLIPPRIDGISRVGLKDWRKGKNITPAQFKKAFGFADVGFGKWVGTKRDQEHLDYAYDSFMDLAELIGVPPEFMGLGGWLHFTIGALGHGKAAAHFQREQEHPKGGTVPVINLTNTKGDGTVAHEWMHALDYKLRESGYGKAVDELVNELKRQYDYDSVYRAVISHLKGQSYFTTMRGQPIESARYAVNYYAYKYASRFKQEADKLGKDYWGNDKELLARAGEAAVSDLLAQREDSAFNNYLVNPQWVGEGLIKPPSYRGTPYPYGEERTRFRDWYRALFDALSLKDKAVVLDVEAFRSKRPTTLQDYAKALDELKANIPAIAEELKQAERAKELAKEQERIAQAEAERQAAEQRAREEAERAQEQAKTPPPGPLSADELSSLFDEAVAELSEANTEQPKAPEPGEKAAQPERWKREDIQDLIDQIEQGKIVLVAAKDLGIPTIHDFPTDSTQHKGFGVFHTLTDAYEAIWDAGGEMSRTTNGQAYTVVVLKRGEIPFWNKEAVLAKLKARLPAPKAQAAPDPAQDSFVSDSLKKAAELGVQGMDEAVKGLYELFGGNAFKTFPGAIDAETYAKAKPHFEAALKNFQEAGKTLKDLAKFLFNQYGPNIKPYFIHFAQELKLAADLTSTSQASASQKLADYVLDELRGGRAITWQNLFKQADAAYGGTQADNVYTVKDAYDGMEAGINRFILDNGMDPREGGIAQAEANIAWLEANILDRIPTQTKRTAEMDEFQQFSTPPTLAYVANWAANLQAGESYLEPSAGIAGLAVFGHNASARITLNELSKRRAAILKEVLPEARLYSEDGQLLHNVLPLTVQPTVVVMNPPFSATGGRMEGKRDSQNGADHVEQALRRLAPGGRLVAIVGEGMADHRPAFKAWWAKIKKDYSVRANVGINGEEYRKYGTTFDNQLLIIDKVVPTERVDPLTGKVDKVSDLPRLLETVRNDRPELSRTDQGGEPITPEPGGANAPEGTPGTGSAPGPATGGRGPRGGRGGQPGAVPPSGPGLPGGTGGPSGGRPPGTGGGPAGGRGGRGGTQPGEEPPPGAGETPGSAGELADGSPTSRPGLTVEVDDTLKKGELTDSLYENYQPRYLKIPGAHAHPGILVESAAMAVVDPPKPTYTPNLPAATVTEGKLSLPQLEPVVYAGQAFEKTLPNGKRKGFLVGDGTGVGKGRIIAGVILDAMRSGRGKRRAVWVSVSQGLYTDSKDYWQAVGGTDPFHEQISNFEPIRHKTGVLFTTYNWMIGKEQRPKSLPTGERFEPRKHLQQLIDWLGEDFDGVIAFDEAHKGGNSVAFGGKAASQTGLAMVELQDRLPNARILYASATAGTEVNNLLYGERLGLWGERTSFSSKLDFANKIASAGVSAMELVAQGMKAGGSYLARSLSFDGVTHQTIEHALSAEQVEIYDGLARTWQELWRAIQNARRQTGQAQAGVRGPASHFWGSQQRFFNAVITSMQLPSAIAQAQRDLAEGKAVVFQLTQTGEAQQGREEARIAAEGLAVEDMDLSPKQTLVNLVRDIFPTQLYQPTTDDHGNEIWVPVLDSEGNPVEDRDLVAQREELIRAIEGITMVDNPLDMILNAFGVDNTAEITGRSRRYVWEPDDREGGMRLKAQSRSDAAKKADVNAFMDGKKNVLVFSEAGGTGFSYHADNTRKNRNKRIHYLVQPGWRAVTAIQGLGRTHRTNEASQPAYQLCTTDLKAQKRFMSSIARRLDQLGALTRGQRQTGGQGMFRPEDNMENQYAQTASNLLLQDAFAGHIEGVSFQDVIVDMMGFDNLVDQQNNRLKQTGLPRTTQFLNRMLQLEVHWQNRIFDEWFERIDSLIQADIEAGTYDEGIKTLRADKIEKLRDEVIYTDEDSGAKARFVELQLTHPMRFTEFEDMRDIAAQAGSNFAGYFRNERTGKVFGLITRGQRTTNTGTVVSKGVIYGVTHKGKSRYVYTDNATAISDGSARMRKTEPRVTYEGPYLRESYGTGNFDSVNSGELEKTVNAHSQDMAAVEAAIQKSIDDTWYYADPNYPENIRNNQHQNLSAEVVRQAKDLTQAMRAAKRRLWARMKENLGSKEVEVSVPQYTSLSEGEAGTAWKAERKDAPTTWTEPANFITGVILPIWDRIPGAAHVVRAQTADGERLIGREVSGRHLDELRRNFGIANNLSRMEPRAIFDAILAGRKALLANGWRIEPVRVSGEQRIEIKMSDASEGDRRLVQQMGAFSERIGFVTRYFIPRGTSGFEVFQRLHASKPVVELEGQDTDPALSRPERSFTFNVTGRISTPVGAPDLDFEAPPPGESAWRVRGYSISRQEADRLQAAGVLGVIRFNTKGPDTTGYQGWFLKEGAKPLYAKQRNYVTGELATVDQRIYNLIDRIEGTRDLVLFSVDKPPAGKNAGYMPLRLTVLQHGSDQPAGLYSRTPSRRQGTTASDLRAHYSSRFGKGIERLEAAGTLQLIQSLDELPPEIRRFVRGDEEGVYWKNKAYIVADNVPLANADQVLLHELGEHFGLKNMIGEKAYTDLQGRISRLYRMGNARVKEAWDGVLREYRDDQGRLLFKEGSEAHLREVIARLGQSNVFGKSDWWRSLLSKIKAFLLRMGLGRVVKTLTDADLNALLVASVRQAAKAARQPALYPEASATQASRPAPVFYSELAQQLSQVKATKAPAVQWKAIINGLKQKGVKADEIEWSGVLDYLDLQQGPVTREQIQTYLAKNGVRVGEELFGEDIAPPRDVVRDEVDRRFEEELARRLESADVPEGYMAEVEDDDGDSRWVVYYPDGRVEDSYDTEDEAEDGLDALNEMLESNLRIDVSNEIDYGDIQAEVEQEYEEKGNTKYAEYTQPGGDYYKELLITLPRGPEKPQAPTGQALSEDEKARLQYLAQSLLDRDHTPAEKAEYQDLSDRFKKSTRPPQTQKTYKSPHWDEPNVLAHIRFDERTDAEGKKVLFIHEIQSDWGQEGKRKGFAVAKPSVRKAERAPYWYAGQMRQDWIITGANGQSETIAFPANLTESQVARESGKEDVSGVVRAPFVTDTKAWVSLALKRAIRYAADHGFDRVAWATGAQQNELYDLSKQVRSIEWDPAAVAKDTTRVTIDVTGQGTQTLYVDNASGDVIRGSGVLGNMAGKALDEVVGKEIAQKILAQPSGDLAGEGLRIGGEGMRGFYDQILPQVANTLLKKFGGGKVVVFNKGSATPTYSVEKVSNMFVVEDANGKQIGAFYYTRGEALQAARELNDKTAGLQFDQPGFDLTPTLKDRALQGLPLFHRAYHGTHTQGIERFSTQYIGSGEGAQAFGWGLYFASKREVANWYRDNLSYPPFIYEGEELNRTAVVDRVADAFPEASRHEIDAALFDWEYGSWKEDVLRHVTHRMNGMPEPTLMATLEAVDYMFQGLERFSRSADTKIQLYPEGGQRTVNAFTPQERSAFWDMAGSVHWYANDPDPLGRVRKMAEDIAAAQSQPNEWGETEQTKTERLRWLKDAQAKLDLLDKYRFNIRRVTERGAVYQVDLSPQEDEYLDWDKPLAEQSDKVKAAIRTLPNAAKLDWLTSGESFYHFDAYYAANRSGFDTQDKPEATSKYLASIGIPGIRYKDASARGQSGGEPSYNYVIFDDSAVSIEAAFSRPIRTPGRAYTPEQETTLGKFDRGVSPSFAQSARARWQASKDRLTTHLRQAIVDRYASFKDVLGSERLWMLAHLAHTAGGAIEAVLRFGAPKLDTSGALDIDRNKPSMRQIVDLLGPETDDWLKWIAGNRAANINRKADDAAKVYGQMKTMIRAVKGHIQTLQRGEPLTQPDAYAKARIAALQAEIKELHADAQDLIYGNISIKGRTYINGLHKLIEYKKQEIALLKDPLSQKDKAKLINALNKAMRQMLTIAKEAKAASEIRERFLKDDDIAALLTLNQGQTAEGKDRAALYDQARQQFETLSDAVVRIGVETGTISEAEADRWATEGFYVPFYRFLEDEAGDNTYGVRGLDNLTGQTAYKQFKGADIPLNDLLTNVALNWHHILDSAMKNQAAREAFDLAEGMGIAKKIAPGLKKAKDVFVRIDGKRQYYRLDDSQDARMVAQSLAAMQYKGLNNFAMRLMNRAKRALTFGVTLSPQFKIRNLIRDSIQAMAAAQVSTKVWENLWTGWNATHFDSQAYARMMMAGGAFGDSGYLYGGAITRESILQDIGNEQLLDAKPKWEKLLRGLFQTYQDFGARLENINRAAEFEQRLGRGDTLLEAAFSARDQLDFSRHGALSAVYELSQVVPFLNARLQGLDKLGRSMKDPRQRKQFWSVTGIYVTAAVMLYLAMQDDDDYKQLEQWQRDAYHAFKLPGSDVMYFIPRPFELGAMAAIAERAAEQLVDDKVHGTLFAERLGHILRDNLNFNPTPQLFIPALEVMANKDFYTGRRLENLGMEQLNPVERKRAWTSETAIGLSKGMDAILWDKAVYSPIQIEHLVNGYLGWLGAFTLGSLDGLYRLATGAPDKPARKAQDMPVVGGFMAEGPARNTRFLTEFYENLDAANKTYADIRHNLTFGRQAEANAEAAENRQSLAWRARYNKVQTTLAKLNRQAELIQAGSMSGEAKRAALDRINRQRNQLARATVEQSFNAF